MKRLVIFDLDGTLLNTLQDLAVSVNHALEECGFPPHPLSEYPLLVGNGVANLIRKALPENHQTPENVERVLSSFFTHYDMNLSIHTHLYPGIHETITRLKEKGILLAVASNKYHSATSQLIDHFFAPGTFALVLGQRTNVPKKPDPAILREILETLEVTAPETLFVGDSGVDMETADRAGITGIGVTWGFRDEQELIESGATHLISDPLELLSYLD